MKFCNVDTRLLFVNDNVEWWKVLTGDWKKCMITFKHVILFPL